MNYLADIRSRFARALAPLIDDPAPLVAMVHPAQNAKFGDYQANCAMPLKNVLNKPPREIAEQIIAGLDIADLCDPPEIAGPGFINLRLKDSVLAADTARLVGDERLGIENVAAPKKYIVDFSAPNIAKPMHVGHLRSTVIGDALCRILRFVGHEVLSDNHIGDWGTQFGMVIYGYRNFLDRENFDQNPVNELARLYRLVHQVAGYQGAVVELPQLRTKLGEKEAAARSMSAAAEQASGPEKKDLNKKAGKLRDEVASVKEEIASAEDKIAKVESNAALKAQCDAHPRIADRAREETAKLHAGDEANRALWEQFMPICQVALDEMYRRMGIAFDLTLGESFYNPMLAEVVDDLIRRGIAVESDGAICVFQEGKKAPFLIRKSDGAFTYATTDLATLKYRVETLKADAALYVVGAPQAEHFELLFGTGKKWGYNLDCRHIGFGSVLDENRQMFRTRSGGTVGLESLLDEAVTRARQIVNENDDRKPTGPELDEAARADVADVVGVGGIKYADLKHNRDSDYVFSWDKMLATTGDSGTYMQYAFARVNGIFRKSGTTRGAVRQSATGTADDIRFTHPAERALAMQIHRFGEVLTEVLVDFRPSPLTAWLFETANAFSTFYTHCKVKDESDDAIRKSRYLLCDLTATAVEKGLDLLGIQVREQM
jgi:arginyl-tRNA synthetase